MENISERIEKILNDPTDAWKRSFEKLHRDAQLLMVVIACSNYTEALEKQKENFHKFKRSLNVTSGISNFDGVFEVLNDSFIKREYNVWGQERLSLYHPSLRELVLHSIQDNPDFRKALVSIADNQTILDYIIFPTKIESEKTRLIQAVSISNNEENALVLSQIKELLQTEGENFANSLSDRLISEIPKKGVWKDIGDRSYKEHKTMSPEDVELRKLPKSFWFQCVKLLIEWLIQRTQEGLLNEKIDEFINILNNIHILKGFLLVPIDFLSLRICLEDKAPRIKAVESYIDILKIYHKYFPGSLSTIWNDSFISKYTKELKEKREESWQSDFEDYDEYYNWETEVEDFKEKVMEFARLFNPTPEELVKILDEIEEMLDNAYPPSEEEENNEEIFRPLEKAKNREKEIVKEIFKDL